MYREIFSGGLWFCEGGDEEWAVKYVKDGEVDWIPVVRWRRKKSGSE